MTGALPRAARANDDPRWRALAALSFDDPHAAFSFTGRLARDNGWSQDFAARVREEYRRFTYLAVAAGHEVTPSDEVDQAWHLHLTYTRHYWGPFTQALGAPLHHNPTAGGARENDRYSDNYEKTLKSYASVFGETPPADIWPCAEKRFGEAPFMQRINRRRHYIAQKRVAAPMIAGAGAAAVLTASVAAQDDGGAASRFIDVLNANPVIGYGSLIVLILLALMGVRSLAGGGAKKRGKEGSAGTGCAGDGKSGKTPDSDGGGDGASGCGSGCGGGG